MLIILACFENPVLQNAILDVLNVAMSGKSILICLITEKILQKIENTQQTSEI